MGYRLAIMPGALLFEIIPAIDNALKLLMQTKTPQLPSAGATVMSTFRRFGAEEWDALRRIHDAAAAA